MFDLALTGTKILGKPACLIPPAVSTHSTAKTSTHSAELQDQCLIHQGRD